MAPSTDREGSQGRLMMAALSFRHLCELFDTRQRATLERLLRARGIRWSRDRRGRPWTTAAELDRALYQEKRKLVPLRSRRAAQCAVDKRR